MSEKFTILEKEILDNLIQANKELIEQLKNQKKHSLTDEWLDSQDIKHILNISDRTIHNWKRKGILKYSKVDGKLYFKKSHIEELLENNMQDIK
jgi:hypothetical protein